MPEFEESMDLAILLGFHVTNNFLAAGMFGQIDVLSAPGAGLRHLDFGMSPMFQSYIAEGTPQMEHITSPLESTQYFVRTYGSEPEM